MLSIFTPLFADEANTNAQSLTAKEILSRLPPDRFKVILLGEGEPDPRIRARENTEIWEYRRHANTLRWLTRLLRARVDVYFFPLEGPLDASFLFLRHWLHLPVALVTYIVMQLDEIEVGRTMARAIREGDAVFGNSRYVAKTVEERFGVTTGTMHSGIKSGLFHAPTAGARLKSGRVRQVVLYAGSLQARKRVELVIREAARWPEVEFRLVGRGEEETRLRALAGELGSSNVTFVGHLRQPELAEEMRKADVFLFPSILEGHPQVLGQAAACGLPAIAMENYHPDYLVNGETGYLVKSEEELREKLDLLLSDQALRSRMSEAAICHSAQFNWDRIAREWADVFVKAGSKARRQS
jgi:glycosyltransferase involved in cell wall biosynthesis